MQAPMAGLQGKIVFHKNLMEMVEMFSSWSSPRQSTVLKPVQADTGDVSQSSSCCPCHKANLQVDLTFHNTFPKTSPLVHYGC